MIYKEFFCRGEAITYTSIQRTQSSGLQAVPLSAVDPGHGDVLQEHHHGERQAGRVVVEHGDKVVPRALHEQQAQEEGDDAAHHCSRAERRGGEVIMRRPDACS